MLAWTREQERVAFYLFGRGTAMPCPDCKAVWVTAMSGALVKASIHHADDCAFMALNRKRVSPNSPAPTGEAKASPVRKSLTTKKGAKQ